MSPEQRLENKVRVTVSWVKRVKNQRGVKEHIMLDSKMVQRDEKKWLEFDILGALKAWQRNPRRNLGLIVEVEDKDMTRLNARKLVQPMNCSAQESSKRFACYEYYH